MVSVSSENEFSVAGASIKQTWALCQEKHNRKVAEGLLEHAGRSTFRGCPSPMHRLHLHENDYFMLKQSEYLKGYSESVEGSIRHAPC
jgi:hypothetical protein